MDSANTVATADARTSMKNARYWLGLTDEAFNSLRRDIQDELSTVSAQFTASGRKADSGGSDVRNKDNRPLVDAALDRILHKWDDELNPPQGSKDKRAVLWDLFRDAKRWPQQLRPQQLRPHRQPRPAGAPNPEPAGKPTSQGHNNERNKATVPAPTTPNNQASFPSVLYRWSDILIRIRVVSQDSEALVLMPVGAATSEESRKGTIHRNHLQLSLLMLELEKQVPGFGVINQLSFVCPDESTALPINGDASLQYALNMTRVSGRWLLDLTAKLEEISNDKDKKRTATEEHNSTNGKRMRLVGSESVTLD